MTHVQISVRGNVVTPDRFVMSGVEHPSIGLIRSALVGVKLSKTQKKMSVEQQKIAKDVLSNVCQFGTATPRDALVEQAYSCFKNGRIRELRESFGFTAWELLRFHVECLLADLYEVPRHVFPLDGVAEQRVIRDIIILVAMLATRPGDWYANGERQRSLPPLP